MTPKIFHAILGGMLVKERELKPIVLKPPPNVIKVLDATGVEKLLEFLENNTEFGFDIETTPHKDFWFRRIRTIQFGNNNVQYVVDLRAFCDNSANILFTCQGEYGKYTLQYAPKLHELLEKLKPYLCTDKKTKVGVNLSFEYMCLYWSFGMRTYGFYDCMMSEKCLYAGLGGKASLKNYDFYAMDSMVERYFGYYIDKTLQTSFNLEEEISDAQHEYAALDTRIPLAIKMIQSIIASGETPASLTKKGKPQLAEHLYYIDKLILGDNLHEIIKIENQAIPSFVDMHLHGEYINIPKWTERVNKSQEKLNNTLQELDKIFLPLVGTKNEAINDKKIEELELKWKGIRDTPTDEEIELKLHIKKMNKSMKKPGWIGETETLMSYTFKLAQLESERKDKKESLKKQCSELSKKRTKITKLKSECEGEALINYSSDAQLLKCLRENFPKLSKLESLDDETLEKHNNIPVVKLIQDYHGLAKEVGTYGLSWVNKWTTHPCKEEGWLNPQDNKLHSQFNQYDAATGRSSSSQPNGQNLPQDKEVRGCFVAALPDEKYSDGYKLITIDMSGAELRILAEEANDPIWIKAFNNDEDVHSVCTELIEGDYWKTIAEPGCAYFKLKEDGNPAHKKCKCKLHNELRNGMKPTNFGLPYGIGPRKLAQQIGKTQKETMILMEKHKKFFPAIWQYLEKSGNNAKMYNKSFDMFGRRRILPEPTHERALENCKEWNEKDLRLPQADCDKNFEMFITVKGRKPTADEKFELTHRRPTAKEIGKSFYQISGSVERQGKNHRIQSTNATIAKICMGAGYDKEGKPFLFHILPKYDATLLKMVHDELVIQVPTIYAEEVAKIAEDAIARAGAMRMTKVRMLSEYHIADYWEK